MISAEIPTYPRITSPFLMISRKTYLTISIGIAKPMPSAPPETEIIEVLIPINSPLELTRAPPEFPGLIAASV